MKNNYGNYVVQSALKLSSGEHKESLINNMIENIERIKEKKLIQKWKQIIESHCPKIFNKQGGKKDSKFKTNSKKAGNHSQNKGLTNDQYNNYNQANGSSSSINKQQTHKEDYGEYNEGTDYNY